ncbi:DNA-directed RNA polymerase I subunit RPA34 [Melopsittacus undulatus]|uniref:DNA-directed RNA polymerase I subunit RPA34 n=1 Tax=Melopsittacus undulatus TaxID=13146 RepID=UPI00146D7AB7|nr:DNA-directed RNA polymerase I subunit RPA34 [Melopsittacus undulatus]
MEGPLRFQCPPEFEAAPPPGPSLVGAAPELWLIRAPPDFNPESLEGCSVPLDHSVQFQPLPHGGAAEPSGSHCLYGARGAPGGAGGLLLLTPTAPSGALGCAPPLQGVLSITQSFGAPPEPPPGRRKRKKRKKEVMEEPPEGGRRGKHKEEAMG